MSNQYDDDRTFMERYGLAVAFGVIALFVGGIALGVYLYAGKIPPPKKPQEIMVHITPLPLPPPPPPPPPPKITPPEQKMVELKPQDKTPPKEAKNDKPPGPPGPKASGPPSDDGIGGAGGNGGDAIGGGGGGTIFGFYASQVGEQIKAALQRNDKTNKASFRNIKTRISVDRTGRIARATLKFSTGDLALDEAIKQVLTNLQLREPPPAGMPPAITLELSGIRPSSN